METMNALGSAVSPGIMGKVWSSSSIWAQYWKQKLCFDFNTETNFPSRLAAASEITMLCDKIFRNRHKLPSWFLSSNQLVFSVSCSWHFIFSILLHFKWKYCIFVLLHCNDFTYFCTQNLWNIMFCYEINYPSTAGMISRLINSTENEMVFHAKVFHESSFSAFWKYFNNFNFIYIFFLNILNIVPSLGQNTHCGGATLGNCDGVSHYFEHFYKTNNEPIHGENNQQINPKLKWL